MTTGFHELDTVVLVRDVPEAGLRAGDPGAIVQTYGDAAVEVEFVTASGRTQAPLALPIRDVRTVRDNDLLAVRSTPIENTIRPGMQPTAAGVSMIAAAADASRSHS
ncbi:MAG: DUF4926 domain-containing protein [Acidimicrobiia bacterium]|nr:DUF4926 domain-containing protein [Acidimicrobiia bacterium]